MLPKSYQTKSPQIPQKVFHFFHMSEIESKNLVASSTSTT